MTINSWLIKTNSFKNRNFTDSIVSDQFFALIGTNRKLNEYGRKKESKLKRQTIIFCYISLLGYNERDCKKDIPFFWVQAKINR